MKTNKSHLNVFSADGLNEIGGLFLFFCFFVLFFGLHGFIYRTAEEGDRIQGEVGVEGHAAKGPRLGVKPRSAAEPQQLI